MHRQFSSCVTIHKDYFLPSFTYIFFSRVHVRSRFLVYKKHSWNWTWNVSSLFSRERDGKLGSQYRQGIDESIVRVVSHCFHLSLLFFFMIIVTLCTLVLILNKSFYHWFFHMNFGKSDTVLENARCCECFNAHSWLIKHSRMCYE